eukprot:g6282.t1
MSFDQKQEDESLSPPGNLPILTEEDIEATKIVSMHPEVPKHHITDVLQDRDGQQFLQKLQNEREVSMKQRKEAIDLLAEEYFGWQPRAIKPIDFYQSVLRVLEKVGIVADDMCSEAAKISMLAMERLQSNFKLQKHMIVEEIKYPEGKLGTLLSNNIEKLKNEELTPTVKDLSYSNEAECKDNLVDTFVDELTQYIEIQLLKIQNSPKNRRLKDKRSRKMKDFKETKVNKRKKFVLTRPRSGVEKKKKKSKSSRRKASRKQEEGGKVSKSALQLQRDALLKKNAYKTKKSLAFRKSIKTLEEEEFQKKWRKELKISTENIAATKIQRCFRKFLEKGAVEDVVALMQSNYMDRLKNFLHHSDDNYVGPDNKFGKTPHLKPNYFSDIRTLHPKYYKSGVDKKKRKSINWIFHLEEMYHEALRKAAKLVKKAEAADAGYDRIMMENESIHLPTGEEKKHAERAWLFAEELERKARKQCLLSVALQKALLNAKEKYISTQLDDSQIN